MSQSSQNPQRQSNIAVLIDGDNAQPKLFEKILLEVARYGRPTIRRIYGDWTAANMSSWKTVLHDHAIAPTKCRDSYNLTKVLAVTAFNY